MSSSSDKECLDSTTGSLKKRVQRQGSEAFSVGVIYNRPGFYMTIEHAKLAALISYIIKMLGFRGSGQFWERLSSQPVTQIYSSNENWDDNIRYGDDIIFENPLVTMLKYPEGIVFVDPMHLAWIHENDRQNATTTRAKTYCETSDSITNPDLQELWKSKASKDLAAIVGYSDSLKLSCGILEERMIEESKLHNDLRSTVISHLEQDQLRSKD